MRRAYVSLVDSEGWRDFVTLGAEAKAHARRRALEGDMSAEAALAVEDYIDRLFAIVEMAIADSDAQLERQQWEDEIVAQRIDLEDDTPRRLF